MAETPKTITLNAGIAITRQAPVSIEGQVFIPVGVDLTGFKVWVDELGGQPFVWPANTPWWDFGQPFKRFWLEGTPATSGSLYIGKCGTRPGLTPPLNPAPVAIKSVPGSAVNNGGANVGANPPTLMVGGLFGTAVEPLSVDALGRLQIALLQALGVSGVTALSAVAGSRLQSSAATNILAAMAPATYQLNGYSPAAGAVAAVMNPGSFLGVPSRIVVAVDNTSGALKMQFKLSNGVPFNSYVDFLAGAAGAALPAGIWIVERSANGLLICSGQAAPGIAIPFPLDTQLGLGVFNTSGATVNANVYVGVS